MNMPAVENKDFIWYCDVKFTNVQFNQSSGAVLPSTGLCKLSTKEQEAQLSPMDRATRRVS